MTHKDISIDSISERTCNSFDESFSSSIKSLRQEAKKKLMMVGFLSYFPDLAPSHSGKLSHTTFCKESLCRKQIP